MTHRLTDPFNVGHSIDARAYTRGVPATQARRCALVLRVASSPAAFTLVELIVVIVVLAVLGGVAITKYRDHATRAREVVFGSEIKAIARTVRDYVLFSSLQPAPADYSQPGGITDAALLSRFTADPIINNGPMGVPVQRISWGVDAPSTLSIRWGIPIGAGFDDIVYNLNWHNVDKVADDGNGNTGYMRPSFNDPDHETEFRIDWIQPY